MTAKIEPMDTAPRDGTHILVLTHDFGWVEAWWDESVTNFHKSQPGFASYDPENMQGDWVSEFQVGDGKDRRLYCGSTPCWWMPKPRNPLTLTCLWCDRPFYAVSDFWLFCERCTAAGRG
jgi:hypothetical protein